MSDAVLGVLFPYAESPEWAFAHRAADAAAEARAKTLGFLEPLRRFTSWSARFGNEVRYVVGEIDRGRVGQVAKAIETVRVLRLSDFGIDVEAK